MPFFLWSRISTFYFAISKNKTLSNITRLAQSITNIANISICPSLSISSDFVPMRTRNYHWIIKSCLLTTCIYDHRSIFISINLSGCSYLPLHSAVNWCCTCTWSKSLETYLLHKCFTANILSPPFTRMLKRIVNQHYILHSRQAVWQFKWMKPVKLCHAKQSCCVVLHGTRAERYYCSSAWLCRSSALIM